MALSHFDESGAAHMVDVSGKPVTSREAVAVGRIKMTSQTLDIAMSGTAKKGDVIGTARLAGIMAAKRTAELIPLCHPLPITHVSISIEPDEGLPGLRISATVRTTGQTGVEMEALTAASVTALTIYDMLKAAEKGMEIGEIRLARKSGGKSGDYEA
ncbi:cyclic pyranopterin monophosphate synthase MoaC [Pseudoroseicyclus sp. CXY001]|uniref:cyclic pyranopterin monophosphate synthase MoaC n=1 Tax=Pseudoroseicyclus sp. CXY001 TaxID=3242492 RepID=UPI0035715B87